MLKILLMNFSINIDGTALKKNSIKLEPSPLLAIIFTFKFPAKCSSSPSSELVVHNYANPETCASMEFQFQNTVHL